MFCGLYLKLKNDLLIMCLAQKVYLGNFVAVLKVTKSCQPSLFLKLLPFLELDINISIPRV